MEGRAGEKHRAENTNASRDWSSAFLSSNQSSTVVMLLSLIEVSRLE